MGFSGFFIPDDLNLQMATNDSISAPTRSRLLAYLLVICVVTVAFNARASATAIGPVLQEVCAGLQMSAGVAGLITALPSFVFALGGLAAPSLSRRWGLHTTLLIAMLLLTVGLSVRSFCNTVAGFLFLTTVAMLGIAFSNVLIPAFIRVHFPNRLTSMTALYSTFMPLGSILAALISSPLAQMLASGWRGALGIWGITALGAVLPLAWLWKQRLRTNQSSRQNKKLSLPATKKTKEHTENRQADLGLTKPPATLWNLFFVPRAVFIMLFFGFQSLNGYVQFGWIAQMFRDNGASAAQAGALLAFLTLLSLPGGFLTPWMVSRLPAPHWQAVILGLLAGVSYLGILYQPLTIAWLWVTLLGISNWCFFITLYLIGTAATSSARTAQISGFAQGFGYLLSGFGPLGVGILKSATGSWVIPLYVLVALSPFLALTGFLSFRGEKIS